VAAHKIGAVALAVALPFAVRAQALPVPVPKSAVLPNYDNVLVGLQQGMEGTAVIARVGDAAATYYNPAGLALAKKTSVNASSSGYVWTRLGSDALGQSVSTSRFDSAPGFFGVVLGEGIISDERLRLGFAITNAVAWEPGGLDQMLQLEGGQSLDYASTVSFSTLTPTVAIGYAPSAALRLGLSASVAYTSFSQNETFSGDVLVAGQSNQFLSNLRANGHVWAILFAAGVQWDITRDLTVGAVLTSPGLRIVGGALVTYQANLTAPTATSNFFFRDKDTALEYKLPLGVGLGLAYRFTAGAIEADIRFHDGTGAYSLYHSDQPIQASVRAADGTTSNSTQPFPDVAYNTRKFVNVSLGGKYQLSNALTLHAGFFTALSPIDDPNTSAFRKANLYGTTVGAAYSSEHFAVSLGLSYEWGSSDPVALGNIEQPVASGLDIKSFTVLYALTYQF
jgi:long-subunit fatty acid transport protein